MSNRELGKLGRGNWVSGLPTKYESDLCNRFSQFYLQKRQTVLIKNTQGLDSHSNHKLKSLINIRVTTLMDKEIVIQRHTSKIATRRSFLRPRSTSRPNLWSKIQIMQKLLRKYVDRFMLPFCSYKRYCISN